MTVAADILPHFHFQPFPKERAKMNANLLRPLILCLLLACGAVSAQDSTPEQATAETTQQTAPLTASAPAAQVEPAAKTIPALDIAWNCDECTHNEKIVPLIVERYTAEARKNGYTVSSTETAKAEIVDFHQRNIGLRIAFGFMSGRDRLQLKLKHGDTERLVGDSTGIAGRGQNALCASVGEQLFQIMAGRSPAK